MASPEAVRQALIQRVSRKVSGHGVTRRSIEGAVDRVLAALPPGLGGPGPADRIAVLSASSAPDLASRARRLFDREGLRVRDIGTGRAGRHTVATIRFAADAAPDLERIATELGASVSLLDDADARQVAG